MSDKVHANRLAHETSPYLKQHAQNPVDWYPWGPEALEKARREDKPIFLSIGYSTCHWCHVMAHECFENPGISAIMNQHFINIKVDREERPDLDETYMTTVQMLTGRGGWPMSVFLTPELRPFYGGTYFPPEDRGGLPGLPRLLLALSQAYQEKRGPLTELGLKIEERLKFLADLSGSPQEPTPGQVAQSAERLLADFDLQHGGFGGAPKFPRSLELSFLLHAGRSHRDPSLGDKVAFSLENMARGGIYDQVGGGFHRYTVDDAWVVPHFEKMLYDNALLIPLYLALYQKQGSALARRVAEETLEFSLRELAAPQGGFYAAWDADSEGEEGKFYVWSQPELEQALGPKDAALAAAALGVTAAGNFEGKNVLTRPLTDGELAQKFGITQTEVTERLAQVRLQLYQVRDQRPRPHRDEKIIASWNGLMLSALALGRQVLGERRYYQAAAQGAHFLLTELFREGRLHRIWAAGKVSMRGFLEDYVCLANACLDLYETDFDVKWLTWASRLAGLTEELFLDPADGAYFYTAHDQEAVLVRSKSVYDQVIPSGNSMAARVCLRLHRFTGETRYQERAGAILRRFQTQALENPWGFAHFWTVQNLWLNSPVEITLVGDPGHEQMAALLETAWRPFLPERRLVLKNPAACQALEDLAPPVKAYAAQGETPVAYVCRDYTCQAPVHEPEELAARLV